MKKIIKRAGYFFSAVLIIVLSFFGIKYFNEIRTLTTLKLIEGTNLYTMEYFSDYRFDEFLKEGAANNNQYYKFVNNVVNQSMNIGLPSSDSVDACSAFTYRDKAGNRYMARNYDYKNDPVLLIVTSPEDAYKSISTVNMKTLGYNSENEPKAFDIKLFGAPYFPCDGVNEKGISTAVLQVNFSRKQKDPSKTTIGVYAVNRLILDHAASIDEAVKLIDSYNIYFDSGLNAQFFIADSKGDSVLVEFVNGKTKLIKNDRKYQIASNFNNAEEEFDKDGYVYTVEYKQWLKNAEASAYDSEHSCFIRYDFMLDTLYNSSGIMTYDTAFKLLENVASPTKLQYSVIYNMSDLEATIITDNDWEKRTTAALSSDIGLKKAN